MVSVVLSESLLFSGSEKELLGGRWMRHVDEDMDLSLSVNCSFILFFWVVFIVFECF